MNEVRDSVVRIELTERLPTRMFHSNGPLRVNHLAVVNHNGTLEIGRVMGGGDDWISEENDRLDPREQVVRQATPDDLAKHEQLRDLADKARMFCTQRVRENKIDMKVSHALYSFDKSKLRVFFTSESRIDFRELVRELAAEFHTRIEMRQIGVRDEARMVGGIGICGLELCCSKWLVKLVPINIRMAKEQNLALNPQNISGMCGRLLCCLSYEYESYRGLRKKFPRAGTRVIIDGDEGVVKDVNLLKQVMAVDINGKVNYYPLEAVTINKPDQRPSTAAPSSTPPPRAAAPAPASAPASAPGSNQGDASPPKRRRRRRGGRARSGGGGGKGEGGGDASPSA